MSKPSRPLRLPLYVLTVAAACCAGAWGGEEDAAAAPAPHRRQAATTPATRPVTDIDLALHRALAKRDLPGAREAIRGGANVNARRERGGPPLISAASSADPKLVQLLLDSGADVNAQAGGLGGAALHYVTAPDIAATLIGRGGDVNLKRQSDGFTPLHQAVAFEREGVVQQLLASGADVNATARYGETPLLLAAGMGDGAGSGIKMAKLLLEAGADVNAASEEGQTPLTRARATGSDRLADFLSSKGAKEVGRRP